MTPYPVRVTNGEAFPALPVLLVDDEEQFLRGERLTLTSEGINHLIECSDSRQVMPLLSQQDLQAIAMDMSMPHLTALDLLPQIVANYPHIPVIIITAVEEVDTAVESMKSGAFDYL